MGRVQGSTGQWARDYTRESVKKVYWHDSQWQDWVDIVRWLHESAEADEKLDPGEIAAMKEDFETLSAEETPYTSDPAKAFELAHANRTGGRTEFKRRRGAAGSKT